MDLSCNEIRRKRDVGITFISMCCLAGSDILCVEFLCKGKKILTSIHELACISALLKWPLQKVLQIKYQEKSMLEG